MYAALLSKAYPDIAEYELLTLGKIKKYTRQDELILFNRKFAFSRLAYTKNIFQVILQIPCDSVQKTIPSLNLQAYYHGSYAARIIRMNGAAHILHEQELGALLWQCLVKPNVDLDHPKTTFTLIITKQSAFLTIPVWTNTEDFEARKMHNLPEPHPTSMHPRLARCLVNILGTQSFLDPFCGAGGLLIEGRKLRLTVTGSDIDPIMIRRAEKNLAHFDLNATLSVADALTIKKRTRGIVTDLPYGRNSKITKGIYKKFFIHAQQLTTRMVVSLPSTIKTGLLLKGTRWKIDKEFTVYLHKTLSKHVLVMHA